MAVLIIDGFDKYKRIAATLFGDDWNTYIGSPPNNTISWASGAYQGDAFVCFQDSGLIKSLPGNYPTLIWGLRFFTPGPNLNAFCVKIGDITTDQVTVRVNATGNIEVRRGSEGGPRFGIQGTTLLDTSAATIAIGTWHYLEARITVSPTVGSYDIYLDNTLIISNTGKNTSASGNSYANAFYFHCVDFLASVEVDDLYVFDTSTAFNNSVVGDSIVETQYPSGDASVQFTEGAAAFGAPFQFGATVFSSSNVLLLRTFTPQANCTINSVSIMPQSTNVSVKAKMVIYADDGSGAPGALLSSGTEVIGCDTGITLTGNLTSPQALLGGTPYWIGLILDTNIVLGVADSLSTNGFSASNTYVSGAPLTAPVMTGNQPDWVMYGNVTTLFNYPEVNQLPLSSPLVNYVTNASVGDEDRYNFPVLDTTPLHVWAVKVSAYCAKSDAGARNIDLLTKVGVTDDPGDFPNQATTGSFQFLSSKWNHNPDTGLAWDYTAVNNATSGIKVIS